MKGKGNNRTVSFCFATIPFMIVELNICLFACGNTVNKRAHV